MPEINGILCIDKPQDFTSFDVVAKMRGIARTRKIGHAGTLDPMATGVLPLFFGRATKACDILPRQDKRYLATFRLGITTDTQDITGTVTGERPVAVTKKQVGVAAAGMTGELLQIPPMYSAVRVNGRRLYDLARQGMQVERQARPVTVYSLALVGADEGAHTYQIDVHCSKGTYIRTLVADLGEVLGCGATLTALRRTMAAGFELSGCITLEEAQRLAGEEKLGSAVLPVSEAFSALPRARLSPKQTRMFLNGVKMDPSRIACPKTDGQIAVYSDTGIFLGIAGIAGGSFKMVKLFALEV